MTNSQVIHIKGDHYQMGYQHGQQVRPLRPHIVKAIEARFVQLEQDGPDETFEALVWETQQVLQTVDPSTVDVIRGLAGSLDLEFDRLLRYNLVAFLNDALTTRRYQTNHKNAETSEGCTTWAAAKPATADSQPILVKNRDYRLEHLPLQIVARAEPETGYRYTYVTSAGSPGVFVAGFNEAGLAIADTHVSSTDVGPGLPTYALSMHILEDHNTVRSALTYLQSVPRLGRNNLLLADADGDIALFEMGHHSSAVLTTKTGILVNTNHFNSSVMQPYFVDTSSRALQGNTFQRYEKVTEVLNNAYGHIDVAIAQQLMASHTNSLASVCRHRSSYSDTSTISAALFLPAQRRMLFCYGQPCQGTYRSFDYLQ